MKTRPVRLIEPFGAGGGPDLIARAIRTKLAEILGQPVVVENHPGGGSTVAPALVAGSAPDGGTLLVNTSAQAYGAALRRDLPYDPLQDFVPIVPITRQPYLLVASRHARFSSVDELVTVEKAAPGRVRFASTGVGTGTHIGVERLNLELGVHAVHVSPAPGQSITDVIAGTVAGHTDYQMVPIEAALPDVRSGNLAALGVTTLRRSSLIPDVPTLDEVGVPGFEFPIWYGVWAPAGTPADTVAKLARDFAATLAWPEVRSALARHGAEPMTMTQSEFARFVIAERDEAARVARAAGIIPRDSGKE